MDLTPTRGSAPLGPLTPHTAGEAVTRWRRLVAARREEMAVLDGERGTFEAPFSGRRGDRFARSALRGRDDDQLVLRLRAAIPPSGTVLDVGSGPGRLALPLARHARAVVAVDQSPQMLERLRAEAARRGLANVETVAGRWEDVTVPVADVAVCAYVLPLVEDVAPFLHKLAASARRRVFLAVAAVSSDLAYDVFWRHFHGRRREPAPTYLDAVAVLRELGVDPDVEVVEAPTLGRFADLDDAAAALRDELLLPDRPEVLTELRTLLEPWLVRTADGLRPPVGTTATALLSWQPAG